MDPESKKMWTAASKYSSLGLFFGVAILIGYLGGRWLDGRLHTNYWQIIGLFVGIAAGFKELVRVARQGMKDQT